MSLPKTRDLHWKASADHTCPVGCTHVGRLFPYMLSLVREANRWLGTGWRQTGPAFQNPQSCRNPTGQYLKPSCPAPSLCFFPVQCSQRTLNPPEIPRNPHTTGIWHVKLRGQHLVDLSSLDDSVSAAKLYSWCILFRCHLWANHWQCPS